MKISKTTTTQPLKRKKALLVFSLLLALCMGNYQAKAGGCNANFTHRTSGLTAFLNDSNNFPSGKGTYNWKFGDGDSATYNYTGYASHTYGYPGAYNVCLTVKDSSGACTATYCDSVFVTRVCDPGFHGNTSRLTLYLYSNNTDTAIKETWYFGDGSSTTGGSPYHIYAKKGTYNVVHEINGPSCRSKDSIPFSVSNCSLYFREIFYDGRTVGLTAYDSSKNTFIWHFGDGTTATGQTVYHTFNSAYDSALTQTMLESIDSTDTCYYSQSIYFSSCYNTAFNYSIYGNTVTATAYQDPHNPNVKLNWNWGDGSTDTGLTAKHLYSGSGSYTITLKIADSICKDSSSKTISNGLQTMMGFVEMSDSFMGAGKPLHHASGYVYLIQLDSADTTLKAIKSFHFSDSSITTNIAYIPFNFTNVAPGQYRLYAAFDTLSDTIVYHNFIPTWSTNALTWNNASVYTVSNQTVGSLVVIMQRGRNTAGSGFTPVKAIGSYLTCDASFTDSIKGNIIYLSPNNPNKYRTYTWHYGDGFAYTARGNVSHYYSKSGSYIVMLTITDSTGNCTDSKSTTISISGSGSCNASYKDSINGNTVHFTADSANYTTYKWSFGDGDTSISKNPVHAYASPGSYYASLTISKGTCSDTKTGLVVISAGSSSCSAAFTYTVSSNAATFAPSKTYYKTYNWYFGDGNTSTSANPTHTYSAKGNYTASLVITDTTGNCSDSSSQTVQIGNYTLGLHIITSDSSLHKSGNIYIIQYNTTDSTLNLVKQAHFSSSSNFIYYHYDSLDAGQYLAKAAFDSLSDTAIYHNYLPTYSDSSLRWSSATQLTVGPTPQSASIIMRKGHNTGGPGFIGGKVAQGANKKGDPISGLEVVLANASTGNPVGYTYSDNTGSYSFKNLPYGTYELFADVLGVMAHPAYITISASDLIYSTSIAVDKDSVVTTINTITTAIDNLKQPGVNGYTIYPNPAGEYVNVSFNNKTNDRMVLNIYDMTGQIMASESASGQGMQTMQVSTSSLINGMYIIELKDAVNGNISHSSLMIAH